ncbi:hypothetical protein V8D89_004246 [Ganoderma adspersum]
MADPAPAPPHNPRGEVMPDFTVGAAMDYIATAQEACHLEEEVHQQQAEEDRGLREGAEHLRQAEAAQCHLEEEECQQEHPEGEGQPGSDRDAMLSTVASTFTFPKIGQELVSARTDYGITEYAMSAL